VTFKDGNLLIAERGSGKTVSGKDLPPVIVGPAQLLSEGGFTVRLKPRSKYSEVIARWQDRASGTIKKKILETGGEGPSMTLREVFQSEAEAEAAGNAKLKELIAGEGELTLEMIGNPLIRAETPVQPTGVDSDADRVWIASKVSHVWDYGEEGGTATTVEAELGIAEKDAKKKKSAGASSSQQNGEYVSILDR
jgi:phage protein D